MTSAIRLGSRGDSYYEYLLYVSISVYYPYTRRADSFLQEAVHSDSAFHMFRSWIRVHYCARQDRTEDVYREACTQTCHNFTSPNCILQMYEDAVQAIHDHLIQKSLQSGLIYTAELIPERSKDDPRGEV